ncbi:MAG TPA: MarR family transcriptional regulator [Dehalococcoidia bacterium]|nr:MarR family transcriptional regulator [Dehalococcoidia bacterium]
MQEAERQRLTDRFVELVEQINQQMHCRPLDEWEGLDLTIPQIKILALLQQGPQRMGSVSAYLGSTFSASTSIIDRLVDKKLVARTLDPDDRRVVICQLTPEGRAAMEKFWSISRLRIVELSECLTSQELQIVVRGMELLHRASEDSSRNLNSLPPDA